MQRFEVKIRGSRHVRLSPGGLQIALETIYSGPHNQTGLKNMSLRLQYYLKLRAMVMILVSCITWMLETSKNVNRPASSRNFH